MERTVKLNNGIEIPRLGLGVYKSGKDTYQAVRWALETGYRHIDTASYYGNEAEVGKAVKDSGIRREDIFITTKMWNEDQRRGSQREAFERSMESLGLDYLDLYLIHWPVEGKFVETWHIMENLYNGGLIRAIGVSNFMESQMDELLENAEIIPAIDQVECHPYNTKQELRDYCRRKGIAFEAWSPLGRGDFFGDPVLKRIAEAHGRSVAQVILRWDMQHDIITIPKSVRRERIEENFDIFDFSLTPEEVHEIDGLNRDRFYIDPLNFNF